MGFDAKTEQSLADVAAHLAQANSVLFITGAGISADSGLPTYRGIGGLYEGNLTEDGFRISEEDLAMRGAGDVIGTAQSGLPRFRIADLERQGALMALARKDAQAFLERDPGMESDRGRAVRLLLWLMEQDRAIRLVTAG